MRSIYELSDKDFLEYVSLLAEGDFVELIFKLSDVKITKLPEEKINSLSEEQVSSILAQSINANNREVFKKIIQHQKLNIRQKTNELTPIQFAIKQKRFDL